MNRRLFWKLCLFISVGVVVLFYLINIFVARTEEGMSFLAKEHIEQLKGWGKQAEQLHIANEHQALEQFIENLKQQENTWAGVSKFSISQVAGLPLTRELTTNYNMGRSVNWKIHLYFPENPMMELPFKSGQTSLLIQLPDRMRPGGYWQYVEITIQIIIPLIIMACIAYLLYRYIMAPLAHLQYATRRFSQGDFDIRAGHFIGTRNDEFAELAATFDKMASRIGEMIISQRQLIADLSHELRTPLARLDIALNTLKGEPNQLAHIERIERESQQIRKLVEDTLTLAWLDNEKPQLSAESLDLVDVLDVLIEDAKFEYTDREVVHHLPENAEIENSSHRAVGQAIENILRNALRYTPSGGTVTVEMGITSSAKIITIKDQGPGVPTQYLDAIFKPFFRLDKSRMAGAHSFGLGLALAQRQLTAVRGNIRAYNLTEGGLCMTISVPAR